MTGLLQQSPSKDQSNTKNENPLSFGENYSLKQTSRTRSWQKISLHTVTALCADTCVFSYALIVLLSNVLFAQTTSVIPSLMLTLGISIGFLCLACLVSLVGSAFYNRYKSLFSAVGMLLLEVGSLIFASHCFGTLEVLALQIGFGFIIGMGLGSACFYRVFDYSYSCANPQILHEAGWILLTFTMGFLVFLIVIAVGVLTAALIVLPLVAFVLYLIISYLNKTSEAQIPPESGNVYRTVYHDNTKFSVLCATKSARWFAVITSILFGYCYNIFPKTTHFAGVYTEAILDAVSPVAALYCIVLIIALAVVCIAIRFSSRGGMYVLGALALIGFAYIYMRMPSMASESLFAVLHSTTALCMLPVIHGILLQINRNPVTLNNPHNQSNTKVNIPPIPKHAILLCPLGIFAGCAFGAIAISLTVPDPLVIMPQEWIDIIVIWLPAAGFVAMAFMVYLSIQKLVFPDADPHYRVLTNANSNADGPATASEHFNPDSQTVKLAQSNEESFQRFQEPNVPQFNNTDNIFEQSTSWNAFKAACLVSQKYSLTAREHEVLELLLQGRSGPYISEHLYLSKSTVKTHIRHIYAKCTVSSRQELINLAQSMVS